jgi:hypothetical protein
MFTQMIPGLMTFGSGVRARPADSGCELGSFRRRGGQQGVRKRELVAAITPERVHPGIDNNLIAIGVSS